jgi:hypothetical protein
VSRQTWQRLRDGGADPRTSLTVVMAEHRMRTNGKFMAAWLTGDGDGAVVSAGTDDEFARLYAALTRFLRQRNPDIVRKAILELMDE